MIKRLSFNPLTGNFDIISAIPQLAADPSSPNAEDAWVLATIGGGSGGGAIIAPLGLGFMAIAPNTGGSSTYQFSYRTQEGTTKRVTLS